MPDGLRQTVMQAGKPVGAEGKEKGGPVCLFPQFPHKGCLFCHLIEPLLLRGRLSGSGDSWAALPSHTLHCSTKTVQRTVAFFLCSWSSWCVGTFSRMVAFQLSLPPPLQGSGSSALSDGPDARPRHWLLHFPSLAPQVSPGCRLWLLDFQR